jgi:hypothetical protein
VNFGDWTALVKESNNLRTITCDSSRDLMPGHSSPIQEQMSDDLDGAALGSIFQHRKVLGVTLVRNHIRGIEP